MQEQRKYENLTYLALWGMLFAVPVLSLYIRKVNDPYYIFNWDELLMIWRQFAIYLVIFLLHNFLLAPLLVYRHKRAIYLCSVAVITGLFMVFQCTHKPPEPDRPAQERMEMMRPHHPGEGHPGGRDPEFVQRRHERH